MYLPLKSFYFLLSFDIFCFFFFFQAEDGIRDTSVTGVQTCALPISGMLSPFRGRNPSTSARIESMPVSRPSKYGEFAERASTTGSHGRIVSMTRSEERRVGKEWRSRRWRDQ